jgi:hypothetical protein
VKLDRFVRLGAGGVLVLVWCYLEARSHTFTWQAELLTAAAIILMVVGFFRVVRSEQPRSFDRGAILTWSVAAAVVVVFELVNLSQGPRFRYPTISSITNELLGHSLPGRALIALGWLGLGVWLAVCGS